MSYERLNLKNDDVLDETHLAHLEDGIANAGQWNLVAEVVLEEETYLVRQSVSGYTEYLILINAVPGAEHTSKSTITVDVSLEGGASSGGGRYIAENAVWNNGSTAIVSYGYFCKPQGAKTIRGELVRMGEDTRNGPANYNYWADGAINEFLIYTDASLNVFGVGTHVQFFAR